MQDPQSIPTLPDFVRDCIDLAQPCLGSRVIAVSDEFFAPAERMLQPEPPRFIDGKYDDHGKWMDGWETRRRRDGGEDWAILRLGRAVADPAPGPGSAPFFYGGEQPDLDPPAHPPASRRRDRAFARLWRAGHRLVGNRWGRQDRPGCAGKRGQSRCVEDGWETRRRREPGHDWCLLALGHAGVIEEIEVDTAFFKGNYPAACSIQAACIEQPLREALVTQSMFWPELLSIKELGPDQVVRFSDLKDLGAVTHLRLNIHPDGGISRLRAFGRVSRC